MKAHSLTVNLETSTAVPDKSEINTVNNTLFNSPWMALAESLREGIMVISRHVKPIYMNQQAKEISQKLSVGDRHLSILPLEISEICYRLIRYGIGNQQSIVTECVTAEQQTIRIRASWVNLGATDGNLPASENQHIVIFLEDRCQILQEDLQFEQQKYQLTDREIEIWSLLRQEYSYQEIAEKLHISLNTVKTHVKNIYAKKRWHQLKDRDEE
ncbi:helix-turn-helix transcriptional regulator [Aerosakkonemataceae cyanobacterium BLCC-F154]|uniref:Helix-turn-helix transcriptional regulator n=1 Tax=Floridaenema fluviatile BLCC-F154 TaxID=3153640 RepID=A0ABV4YCQ4_9CYAN